MKSDKVILAGGTGFLGQSIIHQLSDYEFVVLCRHPKADSEHVRYVKWDGKTMGDWTTEIEGSEVVINLTGRSVDCRYNEQNKKEILESRVLATTVLGQAIQQSQSPPKLWINATSATIYRHATDRPMDEETGEYGKGFSVNVCTAWEAAFHDAQTPDTRKVTLRVAMVLGEKGGVMPVMKRLVQFGLGGKQGKGNQYVSWVHETDFVNSIQWIIQHKELEGIYNCSAPYPVPNAIFMQLMRRACKMPIGLPSAAWMLEIGAWLIRTETELVLKSRWVVPTKLLQSGFRFTYPEVNSAIINIV